MKHKILSPKLSGLNDRSDTRIDAKFKFRGIFASAQVFQWKHQHRKPAPVYSGSVDPQLVKKLDFWADAIYTAMI